MFDSRLALLIGIQDNSQLRKHSKNDNFFDLKTIESDFKAVKDGLKEFNFKDENILEIKNPSQEELNS